MSSDPATARPADALLRAVARLMRPLVRLLMRHGVTFPLLAELLRKIYVEVALRDLLAERGAQTDSRVSLLTGVHRKEIRRLRADATTIDSVPAVVTLSSQLIARWLVTPAMTDAGGLPLPLPRTAQPGDAPSFEGLVRSVTTDVRPRTVLDDWIGANLATLDREDRVVLNQLAFIPRRGGEEQLFYFARNLHDHVAAAAANVAAAGSPPFLDRSVHYDRLSPAAASRLEAAAREAAQRVLIDVNRLAAELADAEPAPDGPSRRVNLGIYLYVEDEPSPGVTP